MSKERKQEIADRTLRCQKRTAYRKDPAKLLRKLQQYLLVAVDLGLAEEVKALVLNDEEIRDEFFTNNRIV